MKFIHDRQNRFNELSAITMRGGDEGKKKKNKDLIVKLPTEEFPYFRNCCLPMEIVLGSIIEKKLSFKTR